MASAAFTAAGIVLPLSYDGDGTLVDANNTVACQIDPNCEMDDERVASIAAAIMSAVNKVSFETKLAEWRGSDPDAAAEGTIEALVTCAGMLEEFGPDCFPPNEHGQIHFARCMTDSVAAEIRAFLANQTAVLTEEAEA